MQTDRVETWRQRVRRSPQLYRCLRLVNRVSSSMRSASPPRVLKGYLAYVRDLVDYRTSQGAEQITLLDLYPCVTDRWKSHPLDYGYFYQDTWASRKIFEGRPRAHVDIGSTALFVGIISQFTPVISVDIRPLQVNLGGLFPVQGSIMALPFADRSLESVSSLCVVEHIGLGRYGDSIDPLGTRTAANELARILAPGGNLYVSVPVAANNRLHFNAHRSFSVNSFCSFFPGLDLVELRFIQADRLLSPGEPFDSSDTASPAVGLFQFTRPRREAR